MAHFVTRNEGFEGGPTVGGTVGMCFDTALEATRGTPEITAEAARSGDYGLKVNPLTGAATESATIALRYTTATGAADATDIDCAIVRVYVQPFSLPSTGDISAELFTLKNAAGTVIHRVNIHSTGVLMLAGVAGTTVLSTGAFYRIELRNDPISTTVLRINGTQELTAPAGDLVNRLILGKSSATGGNGAYTAFFDDIEIETAEDIIDIDYPGPGRVKRLDVDGDGFYDGTWTSTTDPNLYQSVGIPDNGDTDRALSPTSAANQLCTLESTTSAGIASPITSVQFVSVAKQVSLITLGLGLLARSGSTDNSLTGISALTTSYKAYGYASSKSPFTVATWTTAELDGLQVGHRMASIS